MIEKEFGPPFEINGADQGYCFLPKQQNESHSGAVVFLGNKAVLYLDYYVPRNSLSSDKATNQLYIPCHRIDCYGNDNFSVTAPILWNGLLMF